jgi:molybdopterin-binding protein
MKISARNKLHGTIADITKGATTAHVRIDLAGGVTVTASITNEAVDELKLKKGDKAYAVIKGERRDGRARLTRIRRGESAYYSGDRPSARWLKAWMAAGA